ADGAKARVKWLEVVCGTRRPRAELVLEIDGAEHRAEASGDGPVDACFNAVKEILPHDAVLELFQIHAVTEGTDAQATVSVRLNDAGRVVSGTASDTDTILAATRAYVGALGRVPQTASTARPGALVGE
ncbi:MAG: alpha-isopropylmalate synthase regulatory domain-containing protein, partial [Pseudomonadota bacterium]